MGKYYKKRYYRGKREKYSVEQTASVSVLAANTQTGLVIVPPTTTQGMRKVKHVSVSLAQPSSASNATTTIFWAIVYVPQGTGLGTLNIGTGGTASNFYEPNQYVMNCGVADFEAGPVRMYSPVSRNLNSGDQIVLLLSNPTEANVGVDAVIRYAITLN